MTTAAIVRQFYDGLADKSDAWQRDLADDVVFSDASKLLHAEGRDAFIQSFAGFLPAVERVQVQQLIVEDQHAAAVVSYDYVSPSGGRLHQDDAEVWKIANGKIAALTIYFDITAFRAFMGR
jgi:ketosteroid isomerase-like protein